MATNPKDKVYLSDAQLATLASGGTLVDSSDTYTGDENTIYMVDDPTNIVQTTGDSSTDVMSQAAVTQALNNIELPIDSSDVTVGGETYKHITYDDSPVQVQSAIEDGEGANIVDNYAKVDGYYGKMGVGEADIAYEIYSDRQIENPETACPPITFGVTGGEAEIQSGQNKIETLYGNSIVWNQLLNSSTFPESTTTNGITFRRNSNGSITISGTATASASYGSSETLHFNLEDKVWLAGRIEGIIFANALTNNYIHGFRTINSTTGTDIRLRITVSSGTNFTTPVTIYPRIFNLTAMNYPMTGLTNDQIIANFKADYPLDYYDYNAGTILSAKSASLISRGKNQCSGLNQFIRVLPDTEYELTGITTGSLEEYDANQTLIQTTNIVSDKFDGLDSNDITLTANTYYVKIQATTYSDVMFYNTFADNGPGTGVYGEPYVAYEEDTVELPNIELRSVSDTIRDEIYQTGGGIRRVGIIDLGTTFSGTNNWSWQYGGGDGTVFFTNTKPMIPVKNNSTKALILVSSKYTVRAYNDFAGTSGAAAIDLSIAIDNAGGVRIRDNSCSNRTQLQTALTGVYLLYELKTSTPISTTENPGWDEYIKVDNFGTLEFTTNPAQIPQIPQPYFIKYTVNLVEFTDSAYVRTGGDANKIALLSDVDDKIDANNDKLISGDIVVGEAQLSKNFDSKQILTDTTPYLFRTAGGSLEIGDTCKEKKFTGASVVWGQIINPNASDYDNGITISTNTNKSFRLKGTETAAAIVTIQSNVSIISGHKYLLATNHANITGVTIGFESGTQGTLYRDFSGDIFTATSSTTTRIRIAIACS